MYVLNVENTARVKIRNSKSLELKICTMLHTEYHCIEKQLFAWNNIKIQIWDIKDRSLF